MNDGELPRVTARFAADVCRNCKLSAEAVSLLADDLAPLAYLELLIAAGHFTDAETVLAHALPKPEAVWWACQCVRMVVGPEPKREAAEALKAAETWAGAPGDVNRRRTFTAAEAAGLGNPAGCAALAAYLSGGSLAPPNLPAVAPADGLTATCAASALQVAAVLKEPARAGTNHREFLAIGLDVARGKNRWKDNL